MEEYKDIILDQVEYDAEQQQRIIRQHIDASIEHIKAKWPVDEITQALNAINAKSAIWREAARCKNPRIR